MIEYFIKLCYKLFLYFAFDAASSNANILAFFIVLGKLHHQLKQLHNTGELPLQVVKCLTYSLEMSDL